MTDKTAATSASAEAAIYALDGILAALDWLDEGWLDDKLHSAQLKAARTHLIAAGKLLCERTAEQL
ncbi:MAG: hypothetical protein AB7U95_22395 [Reyranella sp.]